MMVLRRALADPAPVLAVAVNVLVVCTLVAGLGASLAALQRQALASSLSLAPAADTVVTATSPYDEDEPARQDAVVRAALEPVLDVAGGDLVGVVETGSYRIQRGAPDGVGRAGFVAVTGVGLRAASGRPPRQAPGDPVEVAAPVGSGLGTGDRLVLRRRAGEPPVRAAVVGTWSVPDPAERAIAGLGALEPDPDSVPLLVDAGEVAGLAGTGSTGRWRAVPDLEALTPEDLAPLAAAATTALTEGEAAGATLGSSVRAETGLGAALAERSRSLAVLRALLLVPAGLLVLVAAAGLVLVAAGLAEVRRTEEGLLRSRGASHGQLVAPTVLETLLLCGAAAGVAPLLATVAVRIGDVRPPLTPTAWLASGTAALGCAVALCLPVVVRALTGDRGQQLSRERQRRRVLTLVAALLLLAAALGAVAVARLRGFGADLGARGAGDTGVDPLLVASPALLLLALGVLAAVLALPPALRGVARLAGSRGVGTALGTRFAARAPGRTVPLALAAALAVGTLAVATVERSSGEQARQARAGYVAGPDVRVTAPADAVRAGAEAERTLLAGLDGVESVSGVHRDPTYVDSLPADAVVADLDRSTAGHLLGPDADPRSWRALPRAGGGALPVLVTEDLAEDAALATGDTVTVTVLGVPAELRVAGTVPFLRTVPDGAGGLLLDAGAALPALGVTDDPDEWWLAVRPGQDGRVAAALADRPRVAADVLTRTGVLRRLDDDPATGGAALGRVLLLTAGGSLLVGALVVWSVLLLRRRERADRARMLAAAGADRRTLVGVLAWEYAVTVGAGLLVGLVAGTAVAAATLRSLTLGPEGDPLLPRPELVLPWPGLLGLPALMLAAPLLVLVAQVLRAHGPALVDEEEQR